MFLEITLCSGKVFQALIPKEMIVAHAVDPKWREKLKPEEAEISLTKKIADIYWRILRAPDFFWDSELGEVLSWTEKKDGQRADTKNIWPLWTIDDAVAWIAEQGCQIFAIYKFTDRERVEVYFSMGGECLACVKAENLLIALLTFILKKLSNKYDV